MKNTQMIKDAIKNLQAAIKESGMTKSLVVQVWPAADAFHAEGVLIGYDSPPLTSMSCLTTQSMHPTFYGFGSTVDEAFTAFAQASKDELVKADELRHIALLGLLTGITHE